MALIALGMRVPEYIKIVSNRAAYREAFKAEAPPFDYASPVKDWVDIRVFEDPDTEVEYLGIKSEANGEPVYDAGRVVALQNFRLFPEVAQTINLLSEPMPPQGALTNAQLRMAQRKRAWPLVLGAGEKIVLAPGIGTIPVVDDGLATTALAAGGFTEADRNIIKNTRLSSLEAFARIERVLASFQNPVPKP